MNSRLISRLSLYADPDGRDADPDGRDAALANGGAGAGRILPDLTLPATPIVPTAVADAVKAPKFTAPRAGIPIPDVGKRGGGNGPGEQYPFGTLEVGQSFGVKGRTAKRMASTVYSAMVRFGTVSPKLDKTGAPILTKAIKKSAGGKPIMELTKTRVFVVRDVDSKTDPDGADVRIWRIADDTSGKAETMMNDAATE